MREEQTQSSCGTRSLRTQPKMGAPVPDELEGYVEQVELALASLEAGDDVPIKSIRASLTVGNTSDPDAVAGFLNALTHFSAQLDDADVAPSRASGLASLFEAALGIDFRECDRTTPEDDSFRQYEGLMEHEPRRYATVLAEAALQPQVIEAFKGFLIDFSSASSRYVELILQTIAGSLFRLPQPEFDQLLQAVHHVVRQILTSYVSASSALVRIVTDKYPHAVRPAVEHHAYARAVLRMVAYCQDRDMAETLLSLVVEKAVVLDTLVPDTVWDLDESACSDEVQKSKKRPRPTDQESTAPDEQDALEKPANSDPPTATRKLTPEAEKIDTVFTEFVYFIDEWIGGSVDEMVGFDRLELLAIQYDIYGLPARRARFVPFLLPYAGSRLGAAGLEYIADRYRRVFLDESRSRRQRISAMMYSAALISRSTLLSTACTLEWMHDVARWLHSYLRRHRAEKAAELERHKTFYACVYALMTAMKTRVDAYDTRQGGRADTADALRIRTLMSSQLKPLSVISSELSDAFCKTVLVHSHMDLSAILSKQSARALSSAGRKSAGRRFSRQVPLETCDLPLVRKHCAQWHTLRRASEVAQPPAKKRRVATSSSG